ncbi:MAG: polyprenyl synthetase family protein [Pseudomonadota bacterium]
MNSAEQIESGLEWAVVAAQLGGSESVHAPRRLSLALRHAVFAGGARVRPHLCMAVACAAAPNANMKAALGAGVAIELLHCASLVHDDLPCFDNAETRRGAPSVHCAYGEPLAVLTGDALIVMAFRALLHFTGETPEKYVALSRLLADSAGPPAGIVAGQAWESEKHIDLRAYHRSKTGALFVAACRAGAVAVDDEPDHWGNLGARLGEAYQVADDICDVLSSEEETGKPAGADSRNGRPNSVHYFGLEGAIEQLNDLIDDAVRAIPLSPGADELRRLVEGQAERLRAFVVQREARERRA